MLRHLMRISESKPYVRERDVLTVMERDLPDGWAPPKASPRFGPGSISHVTPDNQEYLMRNLQTVAIRESFEFKPQLDEAVVRAVLSAIVPTAVLPIEGDTKETLALRGCHMS